MEIPERHPQEIEVWHIIPAIRKELVVALKEKGNSQKKIADLLNLSEAAVSQYLKLKRAREIIFNADVKKYIKDAAGRIKDKTTAYQELQRIIEHVKTTKTICQIHMGMEAGLEGCDICFMKE
ncbi:transcriptional regulator [Candidatus Woesearchaeota archaeon]|nr:transcriptional regulator [Candidatus Woesearchaeota archaeon]